MPLDLALRQQRQVRDLRAQEEMRRRVLAGRHARAAADACRRVHRGFGELLWNRNRIAVGGAAAVDRHEPARRDDAIQRAAIDNQILDDRKGPRPPWLDRDRLAVLEPAHVELTDGGATIGSMRVSFLKGPCGNRALAGVL